MEITEGGIVFELNELTDATAYNYLFKKILILEKEVSILKNVMFVKNKEDEDKNHCKDIKHGDYLKILKGIKILLEKL